MRRNNPEFFWDSEKKYIKNLFYSQTAIGEIRSLWQTPGVTSICQFSPPPQSVSAYVHCSSLCNTVVYFTANSKQDNPVFLPKIMDSSIIYAMLNQQACQALEYEPSLTADNSLAFQSSINILPPNCPQLATLQVSTVFYSHPSPSSSFHQLSFPLSLWHPEFTWVIMFLFSSQLFAFLLFVLLTGWHNLTKAFYPLSSQLSYSPPFPSPFASVQGRRGKDQNHPTRRSSEGFLNRPSLRWALL